MSLFRDAIDKRAEEAISLNPSVQTGFLISTLDVVNDATKDIWFKTFNTMSDWDIYRLKQDAIKSGLSVGLKDVNGVNRKERIFCNPKFADLMIVGTGTGKQATPEGKGMLQADVIFSGTNNQAPTVVGTQFVPIKIRDATQVTSKQVQDNTQPPPLQGDIGGGTDPARFAPDQLVPDLYKQSSNDPTRIQRVKTTTTSENGIVKTKTIVEGGCTPPLLNKDGKEDGTKDKTQRGVYLNSIRTGTLKVSAAELDTLVSTTIASIEGIF
jgi:hypothetical protein